MKDKITNSMCIQPVIESEVQTLIKQSNLSSPGYDSISPTVVKAAESSFILPLTHVLNMSLSTDKHPFVLVNSLTAVLKLQILSMAA